MFEVCGGYAVGPTPESTGLVKKLGNLCRAAESSDEKVLIGKVLWLTRRVWIRGLLDRHPNWPAYFHVSRQELEDAMLTVGEEEIALLAEDPTQVRGRRF